MLSNPPSTGNADLDNFLASVKRHIDDALRPADGWRLSDLSADVSEVISDRRDLIDIVTAYDDITALRASVDLILADYAEAIADHKTLGEQYQDYAEVFSHTMEWWNQNRKIIEDATEAMASTLLASEYADAAAASATAANDSQAAAASSVAAVAQSAVDAAVSERVAGEHKEAAEAASAAAASSADDAASSAAAAASSESAAATSAGEAATSATAASDAADRAENVVDTVQWQGDQLSVMGKVSPPLAGDDGVTPHVGANGNWWVGDTDTGVRAQGEKGDPGDGSGDVLWSDLTPQLEGKSDVGHSHSAADVGASPVGHKHTASDISDATATGRSVLTASSEADARSAIGAGTSNLTLGTTSSTAARGNHTHTPASIGAAPADHTHTPASIGAAPADHTHSEYATTAQVEARTPEIRTVSSPGQATSPGVLYVVMGG